MAKAITDKSDSDLKKLLTEKRTELRKFRFAEAGTKTRNVREGRLARQEIARILTELNRRAKQS